MEELKCPLCKKEYSQINPPRLLTMCGHTYCQECLKSMIKRKEYRFQIRCPEDRLKMSIDSSTPLQFPRNMILVETMNKGKPRLELSEDRNEFLSSKGEISDSHGPRESKQSKRSSAFTTKRTSLEQGLCLLHQKHLDIICLQQKISICAECALFGLHKGHSFTTIRDLQAKRSDWIHQISHIIQQKKAIEEKQTEVQVQTQILRLISKKKDSIMGEISNFCSKMREELQKVQNKLKTEVENQIQRLTEITRKKVLKTDLQDKFKVWETQMMQTIDHLENENVMKSINLYADLILGKKQNFIFKGTELINALKKDFFTFWNDIQTVLEYPKITVYSNIERTISQMISLQLKAKQEQKAPFFEDEVSIRSSIFNQSEIFSKKHQLQQTTRYDPSHTQEQVSLLDLDQNVKTEFNLSEITLRNEQTISIAKQSETPSFVEFEEIKNQPHIFKKSKNKDLSHNKSLTYLRNSRNSFNSPKLKKKTQFSSRGVLPYASPMGRDKLKRSVLKVKDPEKFERLLKAMEADNTESLDFTGLQLGNDITKEVCLKLKECKKVRTIRLMKNQLTDDCLPALMECLSTIEIMNLAQNLFSAKILDYLLIFCKQKKMEKIKNIQLGQNNINSRKFKDKIDQLKRNGIFISL